MGPKSLQETSLTIMLETHQTVHAMLPYSIQNSPAPHSESSPLSRADKITIMSTYRRFEPPPLETEGDVIMYAAAYNPFSDPEPASTEETVNSFSDAAALDEEATPSEVTPSISFRARVSSIQTRVYGTLLWKLKFTGPGSKMCRSLDGAFDAIMAHDREEETDKKKTRKAEKERNSRNSDASVKKLLGAGRGHVTDCERAYGDREYATVSGRGWKNWGGVTGLGI